MYVWQMTGHDEGMTGHFTQQALKFAENIVVRYGLGFGVWLTFELNYIYIHTYYPMHTRYAFYSVEVFRCVKLVEEL